MTGVILRRYFPDYLSDLGLLAYRLRVCNTKLICTLRLPVSAKSGGSVGRFFLQIRPSIYAKSA